MSFAERHGLWTPDRQRQCADIEARMAADGVEVVRLSFADQHGILRGKTLVAAEAVKALRNGCSLTTTLLGKDTAHRTVFSVFDPVRNPGGGLPMAQMAGGGDFLMIPDPASFRILPKSLGEALEAAQADDCLAAGFGRDFIDYYVHIKQAEIARFNLEVTEWEQREYFEMF